MKASLEDSNFKKSVIEGRLVIDCLEIIQATVEPPASI